MERTNRTRSLLGGLAVILTSAGAMAPSAASAQSCSSPNTSASFFEVCKSGGDFPGAQTHTLSTQTMMCMLSGVSGSFDDGDGDGGHEFVHVSGAVGAWHLTAGNGRGGRMICTRWSNFKKVAGGTQFHGEDNSLFVFNRNGDFSLSDDAFHSNAATGIQQMSGEFESDDEMIEVTQSHVVNARNSISIRSHAGDGCLPWPIGCEPTDTEMGTRSGSIFVGNPSDMQLVKFVGNFPNGAVGRGTMGTLSVTEIRVSTESGFSQRDLVPTDPNHALGSLCYFTRLGGDLDGNSEFARITAVNGLWRITVGKGGSGQEVHASTRCMTYDQR